MKRLFIALALLMAMQVGAQTYTNEYPKEMTRLAQKWVKSGAWRNGFTKASPAPTVNPVEFYIQYHRNPTSKSRKLRAMKTDGALPEGYLGMDYVHILPDGTCQRIGHLFISGLIPVKLDVGRGGFSLGPGGDKNNSVTTLTVSYIYAQAMLMIKSGSGSKIIYFE